MYHRVMKRECVRRMQWQNCAGWLDKFVQTCERGVAWTKRQKVLETQLRAAGRLVAVRFSRGSRELVRGHIGILGILLVACSADGF